MSVHAICNFITTYKEEKDVSKTFYLKDDGDSAAIHKSIRSAITRFHLTTETPLAASYSLKSKLRFKKINEFVWSIEFRNVVLNTIRTAAVVLFGLYLLKVFALYSYRQAVEDVANNVYVVKDNYSFGYRPATVPDLLEPIIPIVAGGSLLGIMALAVICNDAYRQLREICFTKEYEVEVRFEKEERSLPKNLANQETIDQKAYIDPITFDEIPKNKAGLYRYLHPTNYVVETASCIKAMLKKDLKTDDDRREHSEHPFEGGELDMNSRDKFESEICKTFGLDDIDEFYECWNVKVYEREIRTQMMIENDSQERPLPREIIANHPLDSSPLTSLAINALDELVDKKREQRFLNLFDKSLYELFPCFQPV